MKNLFFTALVAIVAGGGAFATSSLVPIVYPPGSNQADLYAQGSNTGLDCSSLHTLCSTIYNMNFAYTVPASSGNQNHTTRITLTAAHKHSH